MRAMHVDCPSDIEQRRVGGHRQMAIPTIVRRLSFLVMDETRPSTGFSTAC